MRTVYLSRTDQQPNNARFRWNVFYEFASEKGSLKTDEIGLYREIIFNVSREDFSYLIKQVTTNKQTLKVYQEKYIEIIVEYVSQNDPTLLMTFKLFFNYENIENNMIKDAHVTIQIGNKVVFTKNAIFVLKYIETYNYIGALLTNIGDIYGNFPEEERQNAIWDLKGFPSEELSSISEYIITTYGIHMFFTT